MIISPEQIEAAFEKAPQNTRFFIEEGLLAEKVEEISKRNALPLPVVRQFATLCRNALLGLVSPANFSEELISSGAPATAVATLTSAFLEEIVKEVSVVKIPESEEGASTSDNYKVAQHMLPEGHHHDDQLSPDAVKPSVSASAIVRPEPTPVKTTPIPPVPVSVRPAPITQPAVQPLRPRTMASDVEAMQTGGKSEAKPFVKPQPPAPPAMPVVKPPVSAAAANVHEDLKKYGVDPYREPVE